MMLLAMPPWIMVVETTMESSRPPAARDDSLQRTMTIAAPATTGRVPGAGRPRCRLADARRTV